MIFDKTPATEVLRELHGSAISSLDAALEHEGRGHLDGGHSGRFPWGSGENPHQHYKDFTTRRQELLSKMSEPDVAKAMGFLNKNGEGSTKEMRMWQKAWRAASDYYVVTETHRMLEQGKTPKEIAAALDENEYNIRQYAKDDRLRKVEATKTLVDYLRDQVDKKEVIEIGKDTEKYWDMNITRDKFMTAVYLLKEEGYEVYGGRVDQMANPGKKTTVTVLAKPGTPKSVIYRNGDKIKPMDDNIIKQDDNGNDIIVPRWQYPSSISSKRVTICYPDEGGADKDGLVEIRRGVKDLSLGNNAYAQIRIMVDGTHYIKGMAVYADDLPPGIDIRVNTSKSREKDVFGDVFKPCKIDPATGEIDKSNPFGALLREEGGQSYYTDDDGNKQLSVINITKKAGDWNEWNRELPSQFLAKQPEELISRQLNLSVADRTAEFAEIMSLTNPNLKKRLLTDFAQSCDKAAVDLAGAPLPGQRYQVLLPAPSLDDDHVYTTNYPEGTKVALVRFPHAGTYEIPILTVTHKNDEAKKMIGTNAPDAICINKNNLEILSGADTDGDTVMVLPCNNPDSKVTIVNRKKLKGLENFDPHVQYAIPKGDTTTPRMKWEDEDGKVHDSTQREMGIISNLIMDMTIKGADDNDLAAATRHSMVVIDAAKHKLDYKRSERDNNIAALKKTYQTHIDPDTGEKKVGGASTILTLAKSETHPLKTIGQPKVDEKGNLVYKIDTRMKVGKDGKERPALRKSNRMMDAQTPEEVAALSSGRDKEALYVSYANSMKQLARDARLAEVHTENQHVDPQAKIVYAKEVESLTEKVKKCELNNPRERLAQAASYSIVSAKKDIAKRSGAELSKKDVKKLSQKTLVLMRDRFGAARVPLEVTPKEWEAIQAGAVPVKLFNEVARYAGDDQLREYALPKSTNQEIGAAKQAQIRAWARSGYPTVEIAKALGISVSTVLKYLPDSEQ